LIEGRLGTAPDRSSLVLAAARLILEEALEGEVCDRIGRERCGRADGEAKCYRADARIRLSWFTSVTRPVRLISV
jgi:hypothetical protein